MADRYWVGGSGNWDSRTNTNWSDTSGGAGGFSAPTYADNVIFDSASNATAYTVTFVGGASGTGSISGTTFTATQVNGTLAVGASINRNQSVASQPTDATYIAGGTYIVNQLTGTAGGVGTYTVSVSQTSASAPFSQMPSCADIICSGPASGAITMGGSSPIRPSIYGSMTLAATNVVWTAASEVVFCANTAGKIVTTNGVSIGASANNSITFDGVGGGWTLGSSLTTAFSAVVSVRVNRGDFSTGNFSVTGNGFGSLGTFTRSVTLGSSTLTFAGGTSPITMSPTGLTLDAGTSNIALTTVSTSFLGGGLTYYNLSFTSGGVGTKTLSGNNTFNNLSFAGRSSATGSDTVTLSADQTVNGALSLNPSGAVTASRRFFRSDVFGTQRTLTTPTASTFVFCDFRDIVIAGAAAPISGTRLGNAGNNSGVTFPAPKTVYWVLAAGGNWSSSTTQPWSATSGGAAGESNFPLVQDTAIIQDTGLTSGNTITALNNLLGRVDFSTRTLPMTWRINTNTAQFGGPLFLSPAVTLSGTAGFLTGTATSDAYTIFGFASGPGVIISGTADGTLTITGLASGPGVIISGIASGTLTISGTSQGVFFGPNMYLGTQSILRAYINNQQISRIYVGSDLVLVSVRT